VDVDLIEKKHHVSWREPRTTSPANGRKSNVGRAKPSAALVFFRHDEVTSYAMRRLKIDRLEHYRSRNPGHYWSKNEEALRRKLADDRHRGLLGRGGAWRRFVDLFLARRDGDVEKAARLHAEQNEMARILGGFRPGKQPATRGQARSPVPLSPRRAHRLGGSDFVDFNGELPQAQGNALADVGTRNRAY
jgi:hypothetical protein